MDAAQALADLTEISSQIEAAVLVDSTGAVAGSTFIDAARGERMAAAALELLRAAESAGREGLVQLQASMHEASVFVVRDGDRFVAAVTGPDPTAGLVFYDLKTTLRLAGEEPVAAAQEKAPARKSRKKPEAAEAGEGDGEG